MIVLVVKRNVKKKTDDLLNVWYPPLPNKGKVKITYDILGGIIEEIEETVIFCDRYKTLDILPFNEIDGVTFYLGAMKINGKDVTPVSKLYLDEFINEVYLDYSIYDGIESLGRVLDTYRFRNYIPQIGDFLGDSSFPRGSFYKGYIFKNSVTDSHIFAFPVNLEEEDFEIYRNGIKFTAHINTSRKYPIDTPTGTNYYYGFDIIKAEFYGELLPPEEIDDYVELKSEGVIS